MLILHFPDFYDFINSKSGGTEKNEPAQLKYHIRPIDICMHAFLSSIREFPFSKNLFIIFLVLF